LQIAAAMKTVATLLAALLLAPVAFADDAKTTDTTNDKSQAPKTDTSKDKPADKSAAKTKLTTAELQVLAHYHAVNKMEIDLGKLVKSKADRAEVKSYGEMLVKDHTESDAKLKALAKKTGQTIPAEKPANDAEKQEIAQNKTDTAKLKKLTGPELDKQYLAAMVQGHEKELAKIDTKIADVQNAELSDMLRNMKPVFQHHADHARELQKNEPQAMK
jgi:putative membrane protein